MLTEQDSIQEQIKQLEHGIEICEQAIKKAEKYERLAENADWKSFWADLDPIIGKHRKDIEMACSMLMDAPSQSYVKKDGTLVSSKEDWADFIAQHEIQLSHLVQWKKEPANIMRLAELSRENLPAIRAKLLELKNGSVAVVPRNGDA